MKAFVRSAKGLMAKMDELSIGWRIGLRVLMALNIAVPLFFLPRVEAQATLAAILLAFTTGTVIYARVGFVRLVGAMHWPWIPLLAFFVTRLEQIPANDFFGLWVRAVILTNGLTLISDIKDVTQYLAGNHQPVR